MIHICAEPYDPSGPPACGPYDGEQVISQRVATTVVEYGIAKLAKITEDDLCPKCLEEVGHLLIEMGREIRSEARESH